MAAVVVAHDSKVLDFIAQESPLKSYREDFLLKGRIFLAAL